MRINRLFLIPCTLLVLAGAGCGNKAMTTAKLAAPADTDAILVNQAGYLPGAEKVALVRAVAAKFAVIDAVTGKTVYEGIAGEPVYWELSGDTVRAADFSSLKTEGTYRICIGDSVTCSAPFRIGSDVYHEITKASVKSY